MRRLSLFVDFLNCLFTASQCSFQYLSVLCHKWSRCCITVFSRLIILMIVPFSSGSVDTQWYTCAFTWWTLFQFFLQVDDFDGLWWQFVDRGCCRRSESPSRWRSPCESARLETEHNRFDCLGHLLGDRCFDEVLMMFTESSWSPAVGVRQNGFLESAVATLFYIGFVPCSQCF